MNIYIIFTSSQFIHSIHRFPGVNYWMGLYKDMPGPWLNPVLGKVGWYWLDGSSYNTSLDSLWAAEDGEPSGAFNENCAQIHIDMGRWLDKHCDGSYYYSICKIFI